MWSKIFWFEAFLGPKFGLLWKKWPHFFFDQKWLFEKKITLWGLVSFVKSNFKGGLWSKIFWFEAILGPKFGLFWKKWPYSFFWPKMVFWKKNCLMGSLFLCKIKFKRGHFGSQIWIFILKKWPYYHFWPKRHFWKKYDKACLHSYVKSNFKGGLISEIFWLEAILGPKFGLFYKNYNITLFWPKMYFWKKIWKSRVFICK